MPKSRTIILAGAVAQKPQHGGHTWVFLQYLLGYKRLGWEVLLIDRMDQHASAGFEFLSRCFKSFGLEGRFCILREGMEPMGMSRADLLATVKESALLLNVMGFLRDPQLLEEAPLLAYLDIDPGFPQMWKVSGLHDSMAGHKVFLTVGGDIGKPECIVPTCGHNWIPTLPPVVLEHWPPTVATSGPITSVASWRGAYGPVEHEGKTFGLRVHEFRKFMSLPNAIRQTHPTFELALDIHSAEGRDIAALKSSGWILTDPKSVAGDTHSYRDYINRSSAEFCVAKNMYVQANTGWFSDRSACYLASGKPVIAQDTGWSAHLPHGEGLLKFTSLAEAAAAAEAVCSRPRGHSLAARAIAEEHFNSDKVLTKLLADVGAD